ncbi:hypothetical protein [Streptomyces geranii]|uniref:hypothetical protein n=1 Tax=Streptomyces geranii TaxID=2058923 RepID=UPI0013002854|nr:hypothetical protein [Streptomyces geranii]
MRRRIAAHGSRHAEPAGRLPGLLGDGRLAARSRTELGCARLSASCTPIAQFLGKLGGHQQARLTADRGITYADLSGSALVVAAAARESAIVLRHQGRPAPPRTRPPSPGTATGFPR